MARTQAQVKLILVIVDIIDNCVVASSYDLIVIEFVDTEIEIVAMVS